MKVLIVDDSEVLVQRLKASLAAVMGVEVVGHAGSVADAAREIGKAKPDVIVLDIQMPGGSGIGLLESLMKDPSPPVVIMLSNYSYQQYRKKCLRCGARFFFDKSSEFHKVAETLQSMMDPPLVGEEVGK